MSSATNIPLEDIESGPQAPNPAESARISPVQNGNDLPENLNEPLILHIADSSLNSDEPFTSRILCNDPRQLQQHLGALPPQSDDSVRYISCGFSLQWRWSLNWLDGVYDFQPGNILSTLLQNTGLGDLESFKAEDLLNISKLPRQWHETGAAPWLGFRHIEPSAPCVFMKIHALAGNKLVALFYCFFDSDSYLAEQDEQMYEVLKQTFVEGIPGTFHPLFPRGDRRKISQLIIIHLLKLYIGMSIEALELQMENDQLKPKTLWSDPIQDHDYDRRRSKKLANFAEDLIDAIDFVVSSMTDFSTLKMNTISDTVTVLTEASTELRNLSEDLRASCIRIKRLATRHEELMEIRFEKYRQAIDIQSSQSVMRLTSLATGFLPLSLGASLLSMQSRFSDLGYLLYDFFGIGLLLFFVLLIVYFFLKILSKVHGLTSKMVGKPSPRVKKILKLWNYLIIFAGVLCFYILATFLIGMFHNTSLGIQMLYYASPSVLPIVFVFSYVSYFFFGPRMFNLLPVLWKNKFFTQWIKFRYT